MYKTNIDTTYNNNTTKTGLMTKKIINWSEYNKSLVRRGDLSIFISEDVIKNGRVVLPQKTGKPGRPQEYSDALIELILTVRVLFRLPLRQVTGFARFLFYTMGITSKLPDYTTLDKRMGHLNVRYLDQQTQVTGGVVMLIDSSGFKVFGEGEWMVRKHGATHGRTWRETHIAIDYNTRDIIGLINTTAHVHDNTQLKPLLKQVQDNGYKVKTLIGDGAYDSKDNYLLGRKQHFEMIAPPRKGAIEHLNTGRNHQWYDTPGWEERNAVIRHIEEYGIDGWMADVEYHRRSLVENAFSRLKTIFGDHLQSRKEPTQYTEQCLKAKIINQFNQLGLPKYEWVR